MTEYSPGEPDSWTWPDASTEVGVPEDSAMLLARVRDLEVRLAAKVATLERLAFKAETTVNRLSCRLEWLLNCESAIKRMAAQLNPKTTAEEMVAQTLKGT